MLSPADAPALPAGTRFGPWATRSLIGAGGMGQVYLGCRADGAYEREVAIKLVGAGALDLHHRVLFDHECRVLARMEHPAIAQIHDAGADDHGRPYLVMESIRGEPIDRWCDRHLLSLRARVELLATVCEGVLHAHQKGVIHRDLKPSNVLVGGVDGQPLPKIIDFGIAMHSAGQRGADASGGTPGYASPEQMACCADVDVRADVYSLGALLYVLACGSAPAAPENGGLPAAPSQVLRGLPRAERAAIAAARGSTVRRLPAELGDGLDAVVVQALQPDRGARYASVSALLDDLKRWLAHYPPRAQPGRRLSGLRKLVRRNRLAVAAGVVAAMALAVGLVMASWSLGQAQREAQRARITADFLGSVLASVDPNIAAGLDKTLLLQVLDEASARAARELAVRPDVLADVEMTIGQSLLSLGEYPRAVEHLDNVRRIAARHPRKLRGRDLEAIQDLGQALVSAGDMQRAEAVLREGIAAVRRDRGADRLLVYDMQSRLGWVLREQGRLDEALAESAAAFQGLSWILPADNPWVIDAGGRHVVALGSLGHYDEAIALIRDLIARRTDALGPDHSLTLVLRHSLAVFLMEKGDLAAAEAQMRALLEANLRLHGADSEYAMIAHYHLARAKLRQNKVVEAGPHYRRAMEGLLAQHGPEHHFSIIARHGHADWLLADGQAQRALEVQTELLAIAGRTLGDAHPVTAGVLRGLADAGLALGRLAEARRHAGRAVEIMRGIHGDAEGPLREVLDTQARVEAAAHPEQDETG